MASEPTGEKARAVKARYRGLCEIASLYLHYIDDHIARLAALGQTDLVRAFERWRERLIR